MTPKLAALLGRIFVPSRTKKVDVLTRCQAGRKKPQADSGKKDSQK